MRTRSMNACAIVPLVYLPSCSLYAIAAHYQLQEVSKL
jgi:hypothetical protein